GGDEGAHGVPDDDGLPAAEVVQEAEGVRHVRGQAVGARQAGAAGAAAQVGGVEVEVGEGVGEGGEGQGVGGDAVQGDDGRPGPGPVADGEVAAVGRHGEGPSFADGTEG